jgi:hypothetical protein
VSARERVNSPSFQVGTSSKKKREPPTPFSGGDVSRDMKTGSHSSASKSFNAPRLPVDVKRCTSGARFRPPPARMFGGFVSTCAPPSAACIPPKVPRAGGLSVPNVKPPSALPAAASWAPPRRLEPSPGPSFLRAHPLAETKARPSSCMAQGVVHVTPSTTRRLRELAKSARARQLEACSAFPQKRSCHVSSYGARVALSVNEATLELEIKPVPVSPWGVFLNRLHALRRAIASFFDGPPSAPALMTPSLA